MAETTRHTPEPTPSRKKEEQASPIEEPESTGDEQEMEQAELGGTLEEELGALVALAMMDAEAAAAYVVAAEVIEDEGIRHTILSFQKDHLRHVDDLNDIILERGGERVPSEPPAGRSLMVTLAQSMGALGTDEALLALTGNEQLTNSVYTTAMELGFDEKTTSVIERNKRDEERHLETLVDLCNDMDEEDEES